MAWDRYELGQRDVFYDEEIRGTTIPFALYPPHVEALRSSMLDFTCSVLSLDDDGNTQLDKAKDNWSRKDTHSAVARAYGAQHDAYDFHKGGWSEAKWVQFFRKWFFEPLEGATSEQRDGSRRAARCSYYYDNFGSEVDRLWTQFHDRKQDDTTPFTDFEKKKMPKPDYACFLPIYNLDAEPKIPKASSSEGWKWHQSPNHLLVEQFSWSVLKALWPYGLRPSPFKIFHKEPVEADLKCYPWLIVEHKKEYDKIFHNIRETVYCQASNAAARAVSLNQLAARYAIESIGDSHIPAVPAITTIGPEVKVWIMYHARDFQGPCGHRYYWESKWKQCRSGYVMRAVWEGNMTNVQDAAKFQIILENIHTWAMRVFRPTLSSYIDMWRCVHLHTDLRMAKPIIDRRQQLIERCKTAVPMIQGFLDNKGGLELDNYKDGDATPLLLGMLMQLISSSERQTLVEEVTRVVDEKIKNLNLGPVRISTEARQTSLASQGQGISIGNNRQSVLSPSPTVDPDDPNDGDYVDSQPLDSFRTASSRDGPRNDDSSLRRSTRSALGRTSPSQSILALPADQGSSVEEVLDSLETPRGALTPLSESTTLPVARESPSPVSRATETIRAMEHRIASPRASSPSQSRDLAAAHSPKLFRPIAFNSNDPNPPSERPFAFLSTPDGPRKTLQQPMSFVFGSDFKGFGPGFSGFGSPPQPKREPSDE